MTSNKQTLAQQRKMETETGGRQLRMTVYASLMAALTAAGAYMAIPIGPVPIVLQNLFIYLAGLLLGWRWGLASVGVYILAGAFGLPVFAGGLGGIGRIVGPTGGYLIGFLPAVFLIGWISAKRKGNVVYDVVAMIIGTAVIYAMGVSWLKILTGMTWGKTLAVGMLPFLIGDALKIAAAVPISKALRPIVNKTKEA
ncbi:Substrate-specific component BioY of biotin ECF transporter [Olavius algarvensis associated proteobacterium Delta 3]|nr:Substrate-specific component BioY of biotin ECF transporter [Olavius algarvensis associated proteobacterium Delta 3]CAB5142925.1 Substrate-specific component BioY of biotin ECF transporter [Olavius algarvensis associated proteobacterium Delta 3]